MGLVNYRYISLGLGKDKIVTIIIFDIINEFIYVLYFIFVVCIASCIPNI